ncbi:MAG: sugar ABC transporter permease [Clostridia bacterium]|nr:sugar ABC transporter permease [Clostridia bacterium]
MKSKEFIGYLLPAILITLGLIVLPVLMCILFSFEDYSLGRQQAKFVGFSNYQAVLADSRFHRAVINTLIYVGVSIPVELLLGICLAFLLDSLRHRFFRSLLLGVILLPHILTPVVGSLIFAWLFRSPWGIYDYALNAIGIKISWFGNPWAARALLILFEIWQNTPLVSLVVFAGLQAVPPEPIEAAIVDGASFVQRVRYVFIPLISPLIVFVTLIRSMDAYRVFDSVFVMTGGGPGSATETLTFYNYIMAFRRLEIGKGAAISVITVIMILFILAPFVYRTYREMLRGAY